MSNTQAFIKHLPTIQRQGRVQLLLPESEHNAFLAALKTFNEANPDAQLHPTQSDQGDNGLTGDNYKPSRVYNFTSTLPGQSLDLPTDIKLKNRAALDLLQTQCHNIG